MVVGKMLSWRVFALHHVDREAALFTFHRLKSLAHNKIINENGILPENHLRKTDYSLSKIDLLTLKIPQY